MCQVARCNGRRDSWVLATPHRAAPLPSPAPPSVPGHLDPSSHQRVLMKTGLILLIIGHLNFITGALVHGTVLRFVVDPRDAISLQYVIANAASVISALLTISCGIAALMLSRCLAPTTLKWAVFALSTSSSLSCLSCLLGLAVSIGLTLGTQGRALLAPCPIAGIALVSRECPFDPTRVYSSTLCLWAISLLLDSMEIIFSIRCLLLTVDLLHLGCCCHGAHRRKVTPGPRAQHRPTSMQGWDGPGWAWEHPGGRKIWQPEGLIPPLSFSSSPLPCRSPCRQPLRRARTLGSAWVC
ncbi:transmembrane protein 54 [Falco naumanni]|uniref:transmembrane protein 54 n=1 Tax=Falco naumanni TaxID=148594 RepID=UPI001ADE390B|nr:transmembrane protein 54 [Falco naumanni]